MHRNPPPCLFLWAAQVVMGRLYPLNQGLRRCTSRAGCHACLSYLPALRSARVEMKGAELSVMAPGRHFKILTQEADLGG